MWGVFLMQWVHVMLAIFRFGSVLYADVVVIPALMKLPPEQQKVSALLGRRTSRVMLPVSILVVIFGVLLGTLFGDVQSLTFLFGTAYGITFLIAFLLTAALIAWGQFVTTPTIKRLNDIALDERMIAEGKVPAVYTTRMQQVRLSALFELLCLFVIFTTMILCTLTCKVRVLKGG